METLTIEIKNPEAKRLIHEMIDSDLISVKTSEPSWKERWKTLADSLPPSINISDKDILNEIADIRNKRMAHD